LLTQVHNCQRFSGFLKNRNTARHKISEEERDAEHDSSLDSAFVHQLMAMLYKTQLSVLLRLPDWTSEEAE
jgi:hypothetical protein